MTLSNSHLKIEAMIIGSYLLSHKPEDILIERYIKSNTARQLEFEHDDISLWSFIEKYPHTIGLVDSGLALSNPDSVIRQKIILMLAIIEATPENSKNFIPQKRNLFYLVVIMITALKSTIKGMFGLLLIKIL